MKRWPCPQCMGTDSADACAHGQCQAEQQQRADQERFWEEQRQEAERAELEQRLREGGEG